MREADGMRFSRQMERTPTLNCFPWSSGGMYFSDSHNFQLIVIPLSRVFLLSVASMKKIYAEENVFSIGDRQVCISWITWPVSSPAEIQVPLTEFHLRGSSRDVQTSNNFYNFIYAVNVSCWFCFIRRLHYQYFEPVAVSFSLATPNYRVGISR